MAQGFYVAGGDGAGGVDKLLVSGLQWKPRSGAWETGWSCSRFMGTAGVERGQPSFLGARKRVAARHFSSFGGRPVPD